MAGPVSLAVPFGPADAQCALALGRPGCTAYPAVPFRGDTIHPVQFFRLSEPDALAFATDRER